MLCIEWWHFRWSSVTPCATISSLYKFKFWFQFTNTRWNISQIGVISLNTVIACDEPRFKKTFKFSWKLTYAWLHKTFCCITDNCDKSVLCYCWGAYKINKSELRFCISICCLRKKHRFLNLCSFCLNSMVFWVNTVNLCNQTYVITAW